MLAGKIRLIWIRPQSGKLEETLLVRSVSSSPFPRTSDICLISGFFNEKPLIERALKVICRG
jgi:hypothetical protein